MRLQVSPWEIANYLIEMVQEARLVVVLLLPPPMTCYDYHQQYLIIGGLTSAVWKIISHTTTGGAQE